MRILYLSLYQMIWYISLCRLDAQKLEEWARAQNSTSLVEFSSREGEIEGILRDIAERAGGKGDFSYSRFFAVGLFRLLELGNATEPTILEKVWLPISCRASWQFYLNLKKYLYYYNVFHFYDLMFNLPILVYIFTKF